jgi:hypothetical protein
VRGSGEWAARTSRHSHSPATNETLRCVNHQRNWPNRSKIKNSTHQLAGGQHLKVPQGPIGVHRLGVDGASRPGSRVIP